VRAGAGLVAHVYNEADLVRLKGKMSLGHNRYATSGDSDGAHLQPIVHPEAGFAFAHNGNLPTTDLLEEFLGDHGISTIGMNDSDMMAASIVCYMQSGKTMVDAIEAAWPLFTGAFSCVAMDGVNLVGFRDGMRDSSVVARTDGRRIRGGVRNLRV